MDREKVIYSIERCICHVPDACRDCAYDAGHPYNECVEMLLKDVLALLKEQKAVGPIIPCYECEYWDQNSGLTARRCKKQHRYTTQYDCCSRGKELMQHDTARHPRIR